MAIRELAHRVVRWAIPRPPPPEAPDPHNNIESSGRTNFAAEDKTWCCNHCGSSDIETTAWVTVNTGRITHDILSEDAPRWVIQCHHCQHLDDDEPFHFDDVTRPDLRRAIHQEPTAELDAEGMGHPL